MNCIPIPERSLLISRRGIFLAWRTTAWTIWEPLGAKISITSLLLGG